jgi:hypothetical protein
MDDAQCRAYTYVKPGFQSSKARCWLKKGIPQAKPNNCCVSGIKDSVTHKISPQSQLKTRITKMRGYKNELRQVYQKRLAKINEILRQGQVRMHERSRQKLNNDFKQAFYSEKNIKLKSKVAVTSKFKESITAHKGINPLGNLRIKGIYSPGAKDNANIFDDSYIIISGNFPIKVVKGGLRIEGVLQAEEFQQAKPAVIECEPVTENWNDSWTWHTIIAHIPLIPENVLNANIVIYDQERGMKITSPFQISVYRRFPTIREIQSQTPCFSGSGTCVTAGEDVILKGENFGTPPSAHDGAVCLKFEEYGWTGKSPIYLTPANGTWEKSWSENTIYAKIPKVEELYNRIGVRFIIKDVSRNRQMPHNLIVNLQPRLRYGIISGANYIEFAKHDPADKYWVEDAILIGHHDPGSETCINGNNGWDWFFRKKPLPIGSRVNRVNFAFISPDDPKQTIDMLLDELEEWAKIMSSLDIFDFCKKWAELAATAVYSIFDPEIGMYGVWLKKAPTPDDQSVGLEWHNTCFEMSPFEELPVEYAVNFAIIGLEDNFPK